MSVRFKTAAHLNRTNQIKENVNMITQENKSIKSNIPRKAFLRIAGAGAAALTMLIAACKKTAPVGSSILTDPNDVGPGDLGLLNFALALETLEAAFYTQVVLTPYTGITAAETALLTDIRDHEIGHRELFKAFLNVNASPATITPKFTSIDFTSRTSVLTAAQTFEDLGVAAYNGAGYLFQSSTYLAQFGKIVSVEARHAAVIRNLLNPGSFADNTVVNASGLDGALLPSQVLAKASAFLSSPLTANQLP